MEDSVVSAFSSTLPATWSFVRPVWPAIWTLAKIVVIAVPLILCVAYLTLAERKIIGWIQVRIGPNRVRIFGLFPGLGQPFADVF